ncbi:MAG: serine/threonine protein kinase, partial [Polyangiaceae bacterium]|nr:serine/threonine protein kinase [Polyangiaceae bacterium]
MESPDRDPPELPLPRKLGRTTLLRLLARGGMGEVYLAAVGAIDGAERPCVVKVIRREHAQDPSFFARFLDEARVQAQLGHPGVAQILEASMEGDAPYVVVEYVEGRSLSDLRARAIQSSVKIGWADAVAIGVGIAEGLTAVHERKDARGQPLAIAHRDLSPQNVMVSFDGDTKLIDFGTARGANRKSRTVAGVVYAKPGYVAPEVANATPGGPEVDVYALGVMLWELCSGRRFLQGDAQEHMAAVGQNQRPLPPIAATVGAPAGLDEALAAMTRHDKAARATARQATTALVGLMTSAPPLSSGERGVRARAAQLLAALYPGEPARGRAEFQRLLFDAKKQRAITERADAAAKPAPPPRLPDADGTLPGTRYRLGKRLGAGASAEVWEATHIDLERRVALKVLLTSALSKSPEVDRFRREAALLAELTHASLPRLHEYGAASDGRPFAAMELVEGETLETLLRHEPEPSTELLMRAVRGVAAGLGALHDAGYVHRDVKPANVLLALDGRVLLLDLGLAERVDASVRATGNTPGVTLYGTPEYMPPEQADGRRVDARADVYALAGVAYEVLTGRTPYAEHAGMAQLEQKRARPPESLRSRAPSRQIGRELDAAVLRALSPKADDRPASPAKLVESLEEALQAPARAQARRRRAGGLLVGASLAAALAVLGAGLVRTQPRARELAEAVRARVMGPRSQPAAPAPVVASAEQTPPVDAAPPEPQPVPAAPVAAAEPAPVPDDEPPAIKPNTDPASPRMKALAAVTKGRWRQALKHATAWVKDDPTNEARYTLAKAQAHVGRVGDARATLEAVLEAEPSMDEA